MKKIPFFMGCYNLYYKIRFGRRINRKKRYFHEESETLLKKFSDVLNDSGIVFWLEFGTLLGYYREHDFIKHDDDLDVGLYLSDAEKARECLTKNGFKLVRAFRAEDGGLEESYRYMHTTIDLFYFWVNVENPSVQYAYSFKSPVFPVKRKHLNKELKMTVRRNTIPNNPVEKATFKGCDVYVPKETDKHLRFLYGKNFMIPDPKFNRDDHEDLIQALPYDEKPSVGVFYELPL